MMKFPTPIVGKTKAIRERGITLLFAMLSLVAISFAAAGLVRSTSSNSAVIGNMAFKADSEAIAEQGLNAAINWLATQPESQLVGNQMTLGYYSRAFVNLDATGQNHTNSNRSVIDWKDDNCASVAGGFSGGCLNASPAVQLGDGRSYNFVILRMCAAIGSIDVANSCHTGLAPLRSEDANQGTIDASSAQRTTQTTVQPLYRVLVRANSGRFSQTIAEAMVEF